MESGAGANNNASLEGLAAAGQGKGKGVSKGKHKPLSFVKPDPPNKDIYKQSDDKEPVIVTIKMTGSRTADFTAAFKTAEEKGLLKKGNRPDGYTWHHEPDLNDAGEITMVLIATATHEEYIPHEGSVAQFERRYLAGPPPAKYDSYEAKKVSFEKGWRSKEPKRRKPSGKNTDI